MSKSEIKLLAKQLLIMAGQKPIGEFGRETMIRAAEDLLRLNDLNEEMTVQVSKLWKEVKPSTKAQSIRAKLSTAFDSPKAKEGWLADCVAPDYMWELIDIAAQMGLNEGSK